MHIPPVSTLCLPGQSPRLRLRPQELRSALCQRCWAMQSSQQQSAINFRKVKASCRLHETALVPVAQTATPQSQSAVSQQGTHAILLYFPRQLTVKWVDLQGGTYQALAYSLPECCHLLLQDTFCDIEGQQQPPTGMSVRQKLARLVAHEPLLSATIFGVMLGILAGSLIRLGKPSSKAIDLIGEART